MKSNRQVKRTVPKEPHKFKQGDEVVVSSMSGTHRIKACFYDSCGDCIYSIYGFFGLDMYISEDRISLKED